MRALIVWLFLALAATAARATPELVAPANVCNGCSHPVSWSGVTSPTANDWIGFYAAGAADNAYLAWRYTTGTASGSVSFSIPSGAAFGAYEMRLFANNGWTKLATSNGFNVSPTVSGTVTNGGSGLVGVSVVLNGTACGTTVAGGGWGCFVPLGWSGTVVPSLGGYLFTPASRSVSNVTNHVNSQNFATAAAIQVSGAVTVNGSVQVGVALNASNGGSCTATNASGVYTCAVPSGWSGTITPAYPNGVFTPTSRSYTNVTTAQASQDYAGTVTYQISGSVTLNGLGLPNVAFAATSGGSCTNSNALGVYSCAVSANWTGTVTPSASGYSFSPNSRSYTNVTAAQGSQTYAATLATATAPIYFVQVDHLNTPRLVTDATGTTVWRWDQQEPFGNNVPDENPSALGVFDLPLRLPGQRYDAETGLHYNYYRNYDPSLGRYGESDPIGLAWSLNTYAYVDGNPTRYGDPLGLPHVWQLGRTELERRS
jgi:RHS repeat-associated protein